jgi:hypothetical protein
MSTVQAIESAIKRLDDQDLVCPNETSAED